MSYPVRYNQKRDEWQVCVGGKRWRQAAEVTCYNCLKPYWRPTALRVGEGKYCTKWCADEAKHKKFMAKRVTKYCAICAEPFSNMKPSHAKRRATCLKPECVRAYRSKLTLELQARNREEKVLQ